MKKSNRESRSRNAQVAENRSPRVLIREALRRLLKTVMHGLVHDIFEQVVTALCGPCIETVRPRRASNRARFSGWART